jgi:hypothetical protein
MIDDVADVIAELDAHRARFEAFCRGLTAEELTRPVPASTWEVRDFIAHLATIDGPVEQMFRRMQGERPAEPDNARAGIDSWNDDEVARRRGRSVDDLLAEAGERRASLRRVLERFTAEEISRGFRFGGDSKRRPAEITVVSYLRGWCKHDPMHVADVIRALPELRTGEIEDWLDDRAVRAYQAAMNPAP